MTPTWPWPEAHADLHQSIRRILRVLNGIPVTGWEVSCKLSPGGLATGRLVAGFKPQGVARSYLSRLPATLAMPEEVAAIFTAECHQCRQIGLACEAGTSATGFKVYLEYPAPHAAHALPLSRVIRGFKWRQDSAVWHETGYWRCNGMTVMAAHDRLRQPDMPAQEQAALHIWLADALRLGFNRAGEWRDFQMLLIREADSPRDAIGLRFYESGLLVRHLAPALTSLAAGWDISQQEISRFLAIAANREIGWLHAGLGSNGQPFLNLYCPASRHDAQWALLAGQLHEE